MRSNSKETKLKQRKKFLTIRKSVLPSVKEKILQEVYLSLKKRERNNPINGFVGIYWPLEGEVDLRNLKLNSKIPIALPVSANDGTLSYRSWSKKPLRNDSNGIPAPLEESPLNPEEISLLLVPAIAIDRSGYRLGYGRGYFDRLRSKPKWGNISSLVVIPEACISNVSLPHDPWDIPFEGWISENGESKKFKNYF